MTTWAEFMADAPDLAGAGERLLYRTGHGQALLATVRDDQPPRIHPISVGIEAGGLYAFINPSPKRSDLERDGRYALHTHQDPVAPNEFSLRGRVRLVNDAGLRRTVASGWYFDADESYALFEFDIDSALYGARSSPDEWPPRYTTWAA